MFGFVVGGLAAVWGVMIAVLDQPGTQDHRRTDRWCTALLVAGAVATVAGGVTTLSTLG